MAYCSLPFVHKLSFILLKNTKVFGCWHSAQLCQQHTKKMIDNFSCQKCNLSISHMVFIYDCAVYDGKY